MSQPNNPYADMLDLPHPVSRRHPRMSAEGRAAQFSPFAALTGYDDLIAESVRETTVKTEPDEMLKAELNRKLVYLKDHPMSRGQFTVFFPDTLKDGGEYRQLTGSLARFDGNTGLLLLSSGESFTVDAVSAIEIL